MDSLFGRALVFTRRDRSSSDSGTPAPGFGHDQGRDSSWEDRRNVRLAVEQCQSLAATAQVGHLGTASAAGLPHIVPVTFVVAGQHVFVGIDEKPKSSTDLKRMRNIRENPRAALLWDRYNEDWSKLWWVRADGVAEVLEDGIAWADAWAALNDKYPQYSRRAHEGPVISVTVGRWTGWAFHGP